MLHKILDRLRRPSATVQYEIQRRTFRGGWKNHHKEFDTGESISYRELPKPPNIEENPFYPPGSYRCIKRESGRIKEVMWSRESSDAVSYYERRQKEATQQSSKD
jgi:hypothetical protein